METALDRTNVRKARARIVSYRRCHLAMQQTKKHSVETHRRSFCLEPTAVIVMCSVDRLHHKGRHHRLLIQEGLSELVTVFIHRGK